MQEFLTQQQWMLLDIPFKQKLVDVFGIIRTGASEIRDDYVVSDGYSQSDLKAITLEKMNAYIGSEESSFLRAWDITLSKVNFELNPPVGEIVASKEAVGAMEVIAPQEAKKEEFVEVKEEVTVGVDMATGSDETVAVVIETKEKTNDTKKSK